MKDLSRYDSAKKLIGCSNAKQLEGFDIVLSLLYKYFPKIDCWVRREEDLRIYFGSKSMESNKHDGKPIFRLVKQKDSIIFRISSSSEILYKEIEKMHGPDFSQENVRSTKKYRYLLEELSNDSSSLRKFLEKMSQVKVVREKASGNQNTPYDYPQNTPDDYPKEPTKETVTTSIDGDGGCADKKVWAQINRRRGQSLFRTRLRAHFNDACAITGCNAIEALEAAHIIPHSELIIKDYSCDNGLLLRADIHTLYDLNLIGVNEKGFVYVSPKLNDPLYQKLNGEQVKGCFSDAFSSNLSKRFKIYELVNNVN
jgi:hypothetical protein